MEYSYIPTFRTRKCFPEYTAMRFADYMASSTSAASSASVEDEALASLHQYRVGLKVLYAQADGSASPSSVPPLCTVYYPTNESPTAERRGALPLHVPFGDCRVRAEFKRRVSPLFA